MMDQRVRQLAVERFQRLVCDQMQGLPDMACHVHAAMIDQMVSAGYAVYPEYQIDTEDGRTGRVDIVARDRDNTWLAIEIDARKPRKRSLKKLFLRDWVRVCCLRGVASGATTNDRLDAVISIDVRVAEAGETIDKRAVAQASVRAEEARHCMVGSSDNWVFP